MIIKISDNALPFIPEILRNYFVNQCKNYIPSETVISIMNDLASSEGITPVGHWNLKKATRVFSTAEGIDVLRYEDSSKFEHVFVTDDGVLVFAGYAGWSSAEKLRQIESELADRFAAE